MESKNFYKLFKDAGMIDKVLTQTDCDLIFTKVKTKGARKINYSEFQTALEHIAGKKKCSVDDVAATICGAEAKINATTAQATKFHDDKSLYTGVYANGGPTNVDRQNMMAAGDLSQQHSREPHASGQVQSQFNCEVGERQGAADSVATLCDHPGAALALVDALVQRLLLLLLVLLLLTVQL
ncbi:hypothetical protein QJQ45_007853 [Haematococcus lacustris]|nr:hypothetical protein QJQ45_007853 [Haematococcus lacustris]